MSKISLLEKALLQVESLEDAVKQNAKGILESTMKQELVDLLKEQSEEEEELNTPEEEEEVDAEDAELDTDSEDETADDEFGAEDMDADTDMGGEDEFGSDEESEEGDEDDEDVLDLTGASDGEVLKVFRAMKPEDGIVVKKDGNKIEINTGEEEFIIRLNDEESDEDEVEPDNDADDSEVGDEFGTEDMGAETDMGGEEGVDDEEEELPAEPGLSDELAEGEEEENVYEIELGEEEECEDELEECGDNLPEEEVGEAARTKWNIHGDKNGMNRTGLKSKKMFKAGSGKINEELETLKKQNAEYKKALTLFKEKLNEVAVFNANLAYATRLFTEQSTTKQEKLNILKRFDSISTLTESKGLYKTIKTELENKKPINEALNKISNTPSTSSSKEVEVLSEAKAYENPQFTRMKELMKKVK
jgi:hypothetical protein